MMASRPPITPLIIIIIVIIIIIIIIYFYFLLPSIVKISRVKNNV